MIILYHKTCWYWASFVTSYRGLVFESHRRCDVMYFVYISSRIFL